MYGGIAVGHVEVIGVTKIHGGLLIRAFSATATSQAKAKPSA